MIYFKKRSYQNRVSVSINQLPGYDRTLTTDKERKSEIRFKSNENVLTYLINRFGMDNIFYEESINSITDGEYKTLIRHEKLENKLNIK